MITTVILRFRDLVADTIAEHARLLLEAKEVWWGWWRKENEPDRLKELAALNAKSTEGPIEIGLFDRSRSRYFNAILNDCIFNENGRPIDSPDKMKTPEYYRFNKLPAWFKLTRIDQVSQEQFVQKFSEIPIENYTFFPVVGQDIEAHIERSNLISDAISIRGNTIIHLSDLHFGSDFGFSSTGIPGSFPLMEILENDIKGQMGTDIGLLVVSGDTTSRGDANFLFNVAIPFLHDLRRRLGLEPEQIIIIPGNHDISFKDFTLNYDHESAFNAFLNTFYGTPRKQIELLRFTLPSGKLVEVLPINSIKLRTKETSNYGWVDWQAYEKILALAPQEPRALRIAVMHHHLVPTLREERLPDPSYPYASVSVTLNAAAVIEGLQRHGFQVVLHGHQHTPALNRVARGRYRDGSLELEGYDDILYIVAGGSTGVTASRIDGDIRDNTYGILTIRSNSLHLTTRQFNPSGNVRQLFWAPLAI